MEKAIINGSRIKYLYTRNGKFIYRRVIPARLRNLSSGLSEFKESLRTDVPNIALTRYAEVHARYDMIIDDMRHGIPYDEKKPIPVENLKAVAKSIQIDYKPADKLTNESNEAELAARYAKWEALGKPQGPQFDAIFGAQKDPITLSDALEFHIDHIRDEWMSLDKRSKDKKLNPKKSAIRSFREFLGADADIEALTNNLLESPKHGVYSLRHTFKDRMRIHKFPQELQNYLMGHRDPAMGAHYGSGYSLKDTQEYMLDLEWEGL